ncbi:MAG TPA: hemolysin family protein [Terriglobia bacterium]|nr:hemolysin family protein [Terriglobia bacterium]
MATAVMEMILILILILANGIFAMSEIAVVVARKARLQRWAENGNARARAALDLANSPGQFLSTMQLGITLIGILAGVFSGAAVADLLASQFRRIPSIAAYSETLSLACVVGVVTYLSIIIGELVPKRLALRTPERIAVAVARSLKLLSRIASPAVHFIHKSTEIVLRVLGIGPSREPPVTEEEVRLLLDQGTRAGIFEKAERVMVERVFRLADYTVREIMTRREEIVWLDARETTARILEKIQQSGHSRFPVCLGDLDHVLGVVLIKDLLACNLAGGNADLRPLARQPLQVSEHLPALKLLEAFRRSKTQIALGLNEQGSVTGLVTVHDILEALVGELPGANLT